MLERMWRKGNSLESWWECKLMQSLRRPAWQFLKKQNIELPNVKSPLKVRAGKLCMWGMSEREEWWEMSRSLNQLECGVPIYWDGKDPGLRLVYKSGVLSCSLAWQSRTRPLSIWIDISCHMLTLALNSSKTKLPTDPPLTNNLSDFDIWDYTELFKWDSTQ